MEEKISFTEISMLTSESQTPSRADSPIDTATEIDNAKKRHIVSRIDSDMIRRAFRRGWREPR